MNQFLSFKAEDFAQHEDFLKWVKYPDQYPALNQFWTAFLHSYPQKREVVEEARLLILAITHEKQFIPDNEKQAALWSRIEQTIGEDEPLEEVIPMWQRWYSKAAMVIVLIGAGLFIWDSQQRELPDNNLYETNTALLERFVNNAAVAKTIVLSDGSSIVVQPHGMLEYPKTFDADIREVYLTGEGFFEVKKDPQRPFMVHAGEIVTRVLGTSFTVRNYREEGNVLVQVKTGKVSVFKGHENDSQNPDTSVEGVVLMPNQQVVYARLEGKMTKSLVENPAVLVPVAKQEFEFIDTPVKEVFEVIEEAYGVDVVYDEEALSACFLNASLDDVPLYDKLKLICKGIGASYEIMDSHIIIYGKGCK
jgi:transmembrane sensor